MADNTTKHVLIVGGSPVPSTPDLVAGLAETCELVVAVDRGAHVCREAEIVPDAFVGDADTISEEDLAWVKEKVSRIEELDEEKNATDLAYAFDLAERMIQEAGDTDWVPVLTCSSGGWPDHVLGVYGQLMCYECRRPMLVENGFQAFLLSPLGRPILELGEAARGRTFSLLPLTDCEVSEENMYWELDHEHIEAFSDLGISNIVTTGFARVTVHEGCAMAFQFWDRR